MRFLSLALYAEGPTDHVFLQRVLWRLTYETAYRLSDTKFEIADNFVRGLKPGPGGARENRLQRAFGDAVAAGAVNLLFLHADGDAELATVIAERITPCVEHARSAWLSFGLQCVPVLPVRMTEAWAIVDTVALAVELGTKKSAAELGVDIPSSQLEKHADPKVTLRNAQRVARPTRRPRSRQGIESIPAGLGERCSLATLKTLPAFRRLEADLDGALRRLWHIDPTV